MSGISSLKSPERSQVRQTGQRSVGAGVPTLNKYTRARVAKGESSNYLDLVKALQDIVKQGCSSSKSALPKVLAGLSKFGDLPPAIIPLLTAILRAPDKKDENLRKLQRIAYYLLQLTYGPGSGGTPLPFSPRAGGTHAATIPYEAASPSWQEVKAPDAGPARQRLSLRLLAAAARSSGHSGAAPEESPAALELAEIAGDILKGSLAAQQTAKKRTSPFKSGLRTSRAGRDDEAKGAAMRGVLPAIRVGLAPGLQLTEELISRSYGGILSSDPVTVRHALALAAADAHADAVRAAEAMGKHLQATITACGASGALCSAPGQARSPQKAGDAIVLDDPFARTYLAYACAAVVHDDHFSAASARQEAHPFWAALVLLATKDPVDFVALEAIRQLSGAPVPTAARLSGDGSFSLSRAGPAASAPRPPTGGARAGQCRAASSGTGITPFSPTAQAARSAARAPSAQASEHRAVQIRSWMMILKETQRSTVLSAAPTGQANPSSPATMQDGAEKHEKPNETLIAHIIGRVRNALKTRHAPSVCKAARVAAALAEARVHAVEEHGSPAQGGSVVVRAFELLKKDLLGVAEGRSDAHQRCAAIEALLWLQLDGQQLLLSPDALHNHVSVLASSRDSVEPWPAHLVAKLLRCVASRLAASHALAPLLLECSVAVAAAVPSRVSSEQLTLLWTAALDCGPAARSAAAHAAFEVLNSPPPHIAKTAADGERRGGSEAAAWSRLQRVAAWWLGSNANLAAGEVVWEKRRWAAPGGVHASDSMLEAVAKAGRRNPLLAGIIGQLQQALLAGSWQVRVAAAQALGKIAVRSPEPFRLQCYSILRGVTTGVGGGSGGGDPLGLASTAVPMLRVLDACYSSECVLGSCIARWGSSPDGWPEEHLASVRARHQQLLAEVCAKVCFVPPRSFLPMGRASAPFVAALPATDELQKWPSGAAGSEPVRSGLASMSSGLEGSGLEELLSTPEDEGESPEEALPTLGGYEPADATDSDGRDASAFGRGAGPLADGSPEQQRDSSSSPDDQPAADGDGDGGGKGGAGDGNSVDGDLPTAKAESSEAGLDDRSGTDFLGGNTVSGDGVAEGASSEQAFPSAAPTIASLRIGMGRGSPTEASSSAAGNRAGQHRRQGSDFVFDSPSNKLVLDQAAAIPVDSEPFADSLFGNMGKGDQAFFGAGTVPGGPEPGAAMSPLSKPGPSPGDQGAEPESDNDSSEAGSCCFVEKDVSFGEVFIKDIHEEDGADVHNGIGSPEPSAGENGDGARNNMAGGAMPAGGLGSGTGLPPGLPPGAEAAMAPPGVSHSASTEAQTAKDFSSWDPFGEASSPAIAPGNVPEAFANSCVSEPPSSLSLPGGGPPLSPPESQIPEEPHAGREQPRDCLPSAGPECTASATVLYSFQAEEPGEVSVLQGESVRIVEDAPMLVGSGWTHVCTLNGRTGVVPSGYLQIEGREGVAPMPAMIPPCQGRVLYDFMGEEEAELTVAAGDLLNVMSTVDGWCKVSRVTDGAAGLVPASYIGEAPS